MGSFSEDEATLYGCMSIRRYRCNFEGREVLMGGVGGVSSLPQYRRRNGAIRACIGAALQDMYEKEFSFSFSIRSAPSITGNSAMRSVRKPGVDGAASGYENHGCGREY